MEQLPQQPDEHEGDKYLRLLGLSHLADTPINHKGQHLQARDFLEICGDHARAPLMGFETLDENDPRYETMKQALQSYITQFIQPQQNS